MKINAIFFDFDGVLAESVDVKTQAFRKLYLPFGKEVADKAVEHHMLHGGMSRFEKFKHYHQEFLGVKLSENEIEELANKFSGLVLEGVVNSEEVIGAMQFLEKYYKMFDFYIVTGTPTEEIRIIVQKRAMAHYFVEAYGSPQKKSSIVKDILDTVSYRAENTVFLGDAMADYRAAIDNDLTFVLRETEENKEMFKDFDGPRFTDFYEFEKIFRQLI